MNTQFPETLQQGPADVTSPPLPAAPEGIARASRQPGKSVFLNEHIVEIVSDSGEGAQRCGQSFGSIAARMGNGTWTVEIIPAEIQPPARSIAGASGNRVRLASRPVTNGGDEADLVVAFNEQVLLKRVQEGELKPGCVVLIENKWRTDRNDEIAATYLRTFDRLIADGYDVHEIPMEVECLRYVDNPGRGKNMFALGVLCHVYCFDLQVARKQVAFIFAKKDSAVVDSNIRLLEAGYEWAETNLDIRFYIPPSDVSKPQIVINGNIAVGLGVMASGMEVCAMYPITPATSASHYLSDVFANVGGVVHQAEDEIAACAFAIGSSYAGKCAVTITSGPGFALKQETIALAVMAEIPLVVVNVQRGGPSTGLPTKVEQGDLLFACFGGHGDTPKVVMAASGIEDCFYSIITARKIAETFNTVVVVLTDASLASAQQPIPKPEIDTDWFAPPIDQNAVPIDAKPYDWDATTGLAQRFIPGQPNGMHCLTGLAHDRLSHVAYEPETNQEGLRSRSLKIATLQKTLKTPTVFGESDGEMLIVGWGSTKGAIEEAVECLRAEGRRVSSLHLKFLHPMAAGIREILQCFDQVMTIENNWSDSYENDVIDADNRRYSELAWLLRARFLIDVDCWSEVKGQPLKPNTIVTAVRKKLGRKKTQRKGI
ncbi:MAG: 2-oxoacid:acceptor oxidoreductase subunit alpha [Rhodospirillaceae bacterium]|jgi:2-oxoglutarate/2-oxoacid ferredoxin oxidoreductase subunit alpha|nr:2-oxoacid:acceptor oxidoreductase subunit alpha [Rhodospirillaceae bacterium]